MLEKLDAAGVADFQNRHGRQLNGFVLAQQRVGTIVRAVTEMGFCYLFEVIDPATRKVHAVSLHGGYLGELELSPMLRVGCLIQEAKGNFRNEGSWRVRTLTKLCQ